jgi:hypothetical protein
MVHTLPDYTTKYKMVTVFGQIDDAELAARLNSPVTFDRRGNVVYLDTFDSSTINWNQDLKGGRGAISISADRSWTGNTSLKLETGATANDWCWLTKRFLLTTANRIGLSLTVHAQSNNANLLIYLMGTTTTYSYTMLVEYDWENKTLKYQDDQGAWQTLTSNIEKGAAKELWTPIKMVLDFEEKKMVRIICGGVEYDVSTKPLASTGGSYDPKIIVWLIYTTEAAAAATAYIDNVILTQNEP